MPSRPNSYGYNWILAVTWKECINLDYNSSVWIIYRLYECVLLREDYEVDEFWKVINIIAIMFIGHFVIGHFEAWLKKKKLFGYKDN